MKTSYFVNKKLLTIPKQLLVSVAAKTPMDGIRIYKPLCPSWNLVGAYKRQEINEQEYTQLYYNECLNNLDPKRVFNELGKDSILLCYEKPSKFCHRHLIAYWLSSNLQVEIVELS